MDALDPNKVKPSSIGKNDTSNIDCVVGFQYLYKYIYFLSIMIFTC